MSYADKTKEDIRKNKVVILMSIPTAKEKEVITMLLPDKWRLESRHGVLR